MKTIQGIKTCSRCRTPKPATSDYFFRKSTTADGFNTYCKTCVRVLTGTRGYDRTQYLRQRERRTQSQSEYRAANREKVRESMRKTRQKSIGKRRANKARWKADQLSATPKWADLSAIKVIYDGADYISRLTGVRFEVDHIAPLRSPIICGLHVPANLQYLTREENGRKRNSFAPK